MKTVSCSCFKHYITMVVYQIWEIINCRYQLLVFRKKKRNYQSFKNFIFMKY